MEMNKENEKILKSYFDTEGKLKLLPNKEKKKLVILNYLIDRFEKEKEYTEKEVNEILKPFFDDYVYLRRSLIDYRLLNRKDDGRAYWVEQERLNTNE